MVTRSDKEWAAMCPYGRWLCNDGREVLFNRQYWPILERVNGGPARAAHPNEWVTGIIEEEYFGGGHSMPWHPGSDGKILETINKVLGEWGLPPMPPAPELKSPTGHVGSGPTPYRYTRQKKDNPWVAKLNGGRANR